MKGTTIRVIKVDTRSTDYSSKTLGADIKWSLDP